MSAPQAGAGLVYVGFWLRLLAVVIDVVLVTLVTLPLLFAIYGEDYLVPKLVHGPAEVLISWVLPAVALIIFWKFRGATPGKMMFSARIVDARTGGPLSTAQCIGRYFAYLAATIPLCLGFLWIAFDPRKQGWHDKLANTVVVRPGSTAST